MPARTRLPAMPKREPSAGQEAAERRILSPKRRAAVKMPMQSERDFQAAVVELAGLLGWRAYHSWTSIHSVAGFPDLVLVRRPRVIFAELKREDRSATDAQQAWLDELRACGQEVYLWKPSMWNEIEAALGAAADDRRQDGS